MKKILNIILILIFFAFLYNLVDMMFKRQKEGGLKEITTDNHRGKHPRAIEEGKCQPDTSPIW